GSVQDCVDAGEAPTGRADVGRMIAALRAVEAETPEPICYLISGDLAHIGPKFGDNRLAEGEWMEQSRAQDQAILRQAVAADPDGYFRIVAGEGDRRRICGLPPTYTVLSALRPSPLPPSPGGRGEGVRGKLLHYGQYVHPRGQESVSFASMAFYR